MLARWLAFFQDGHISFSRTAAAGPAAGDDDIAPDEIRARYADRPQRELAEPQARARLDALGAARAPIEGIWEMSGGNYRGVVLRDDDAGTRFTMSILRADSVWWVPGQVKAIFTPAPDGRYTVRFFMRDHSEQAWTGRVAGSVLTLDRGSPWFREYPVLPGDVTREQYEATRNTRFAAREVEPGTVLLQLPTFGDTESMDRLMQAERERLRAAERLVIDLRGNGGGSDYNFRELIPLIYTDTIRIISIAALATEDNIRVNEELARDSTVPGPIRIQLANNAAQMRTALGGWYEFPDRTHVEAVVPDLPRRVDIVIDRGCASSCEQFLLAARQSRKVTIYGSRSAGVLDFGNVRRGRHAGRHARAALPDHAVEAAARRPGRSARDSAPRARA
jgi:hypothetical protein